MSGALLAAVVAGVGGALAGRVADSLALVAPRRAGAGEGTVAVRVDWRARAVGTPWPELAGALCAAAVTLRFGWTAQLPAWLWFVAIGLLLTVVDLREQLLPNRVLLPGLLGGLALLTVAAGATGDWPDLGRAVLAGGAAFAVLLAMALISPSGLGMGDVKLAALLGLYLGWLGWPVVLAGFFLGFLLQAAVGLALLATRRVGRRTGLPFGPALLAGALVVAVLTEDWLLPLA
ncbi:A24 family peptidase [Modestobacter sp. VKM Ac-2983]|uniref:prepilin peptidase n=1 Tax=Modestobacter sp. VKM Ac-2983 TaxID=3004137 RepID=UPI0022AB5396|nr:A24 family peptidase [Modestobacter sp. VKM Ac-2983]MCZ2804464.1 A24 family peptidase [Modestobacter sp. VKM Ac-2983]